MFIDTNRVFFPSDNKISLSNESTDILSRLKQINNSYFFRPDRSLTNKLNTVNAVELTKILKCFFMEMVQEERIEDPVKFLERLATILPFAKLQEAVKDDVEDALAEAKGMFEEAKFYLESSQNKSNSRAQVLLILDGISSILETIILAFGIGAFFKPAESDLDAEFKSQKIMMLLSFFSTITATLLPATSATGRLIIGGIFIAIAALSVVWPFIKPKPSYLPADAENWTRRVQKGDFIAQGRRESLDQIANILKINRHAILVGSSRVGKSLTAKAFVQEVEKNKYPELKNKVFFRINTADLTIPNGPSFRGGGNKILRKISEAMGRHRNNIVLILDEMHMACKNNEKLADQLKPFLDEGGEFPHVIGITTKEEYEKHVKDNNAFCLRFDKVNIENTSKDETLRILVDALLRSNYKPLIQENALEYIYKKSFEIKDAPQPAASIKLLKQCINQTVKTQKSSTEKKVVEISNKILFLRSQAILNRQKRKDIRIQIAELEQQMRDLQIHLDNEQKQLNKLFKAKDLLHRVTKETYSCVLKVSSIAQETLNPKTEKQLKLFLLLNEFLSESLEFHIEATAKKLKTNTIVDKRLIDEVINENLINEAAQA